MTDPFDEFVRLQMKGAIGSPLQAFLFGIAFGALGVRLSQEDIVKMVAEVMEKAGRK